MPESLQGSSIIAKKVAKNKNYGGFTDKSKSLN